MPRLSANLTLLFTELPFLERYQAAAEAGFRGVECLFPYAWPAQSLAMELRTHQLQQVLFNAPAGDWDAGERGIACHPDRRQEFRDGVARAMDYAGVLECPRIHCLAGLKPESVSTAAAWDCYRENLAWAADQLQAAGFTLLIEPINSRVDMPGYLLDRVDDARDLIDTLGRENLRLQLDLYHAAIMEPDVSAVIERHASVIEHVQFADAPGRHEPGTGRLDLARWFRQLDQQGYQGWVGAEYLPRQSTRESLSALASWLH